MSCFIYLRRAIDTVHSKLKNDFYTGKRTSDQMFVFKTLIENYTQKGSKQLFSCFVDFRRAIDTVHPKLKT